MPALLPFQVICVRKALVMTRKPKAEVVGQAVIQTGKFVTVLGKLVETVQPVT